MVTSLASSGSCSLPLQPAQPLTPLRHMWEPFGAPCGWGGSAGPRLTPSLAQEPKEQGGWFPAPADILLRLGLQAPSQQDTRWHPPQPSAGHSPHPAPIHPGHCRESQSPPGLRRVGAAAGAPSPRSLCLSVWNASVFLSPRAVVNARASVGASVQCLSLSLFHFLCIWCVCLCLPAACGRGTPIWGN